MYGWDYVCRWDYVCGSDYMCMGLRVVGLCVVWDGIWIVLPWLCLLLAMTCFECGRFRLR